MTICDGKKQLSFTIADYQYPDAKRSTKKDYNYDANWLTVRVSVTQENEPLTDEDPCLMTDELIDMRRGMNAILAGKRSCAILETLEPYFRIAFAATAGGFVILMEYHVWEGRRHVVTWSAAEHMDRARFREIRDEIAALCEKYPER